MLLKSLRCVLILAGAAALPLYAQNPPANETMPTNPSTTTTTTATATHGKKAKVDTKTVTTTTTTKTTTKTAMHHHHKRHTTGGASEHMYAARLAALLTDAQDKATLTPEAWKMVSNEAARLAGHLRGKDGMEARKHVREMRAAAMKGDADDARSHASMALPYVTKLI